MKAPLFEVLTSREAADLWGLSENTVTQWCNRGRFESHEARKSGKVWLVTREGMERLTKNKGEDDMSKFWNTGNAVILKDLLAPFIGKARVDAPLNLNEDIKVLDTEIRVYNSERKDEEGTRYDISNAFAIIDFENKTCHIDYKVNWIGGLIEGKEITFPIEWHKSNDKIGITEITVFERK